eukprot:gene12331-15068_t
MSAFALLIPPASFSTHLHRLTERSSTASPEGDTRSFGVWVAASKPTS